MPRGEELVLLVEDEDAVRSLAEHVLRSCGYEVLAAADGRQAVRLAQNHRRPIQLLIADVVMPHIGGRAVADQVAVLQPGIKVLFVSGYMDDAVVRHGIVRDETAFLQKPYSPTGLARKVREVLDGHDRH
jgi:CheY-like chemotaxis protein